jgi:Protein of unknown function (DUF1569)
MAKNIFTTSDYNNTINRMQHLNSNSTAQWGKMNVIQMMEHCAIQLKMALKILPEGKPEGLALLKTALGKWLSLYIMPWSKGTTSPTAMNMELNNATLATFEEEKKLLQELLGQVLHKNEFTAHPIFGKLTKKDWGRLIWKHLNHHLTQFGV